MAIGLIVVITTNAQATPIGISTTPICYNKLSDAAMDLGTPSAPPIIDIGREELNTETTDENQPGMSSGGRFDLKKNNEEEENMFKVESAPHEFCKRYTFVVVYVILLVQDLFSLMPWLSMEILL